MENCGSVAMAYHILACSSLPMLALLSCSAPHWTARSRNWLTALSTLAGCLWRTKLPSNLGSAPPQKSFPSPEKTTQRMSLRWCSKITASHKPAHMDAFKTLPASGRLSVTYAIPCPSSTFTSLCCQSSKEQDGAYQERSGVGSTIFAQGRWSHAFL